MATSDRPAGVHFDKVLQTLRGQVQDMRQEFLESEIPISDDHQALHTFCEKLEFLLKFGIKERAGLLGGRRDLWQYLCKCLADRRNIHDGLRVIKANTELKTGVGRARCFVRYCLVHQCLADVLQQCVDNSAVTQQFYQSGSLLLNPSLTTTLITILYELCDVTFDLPPTGHDLDVSWPTFARLGLGGSWRPPSRSMSISSLSSYVSQYSEAVVGSVPQSPTMAAVSEDYPDLAGSPQLDLQRENQHLRDTVHQLREQLAKINTSSNSAEDTEETKEEDNKRASKETINDLEQRLEECKKDYEKIFLDLSISQQRNRVFELIEKELQSRIEELQGHVKSYEFSEREYRNKIDDLECKLESTTAANDRLTASLRELAETKCDEDNNSVDQVSQLTSQLAQLELSNTDYQTNVKEHLHRINQLQEEITLLQEDKVILGKQLEQAEQEKTKLRANIRKVSSNWFERKDRHSESEVEGSDKLEDGCKIKDHSGESLGQLLRQMELSEKRCCELRKRVQDCERIIDDQGIIILGMKEQIDSYFSDNQKMSKQLNAFASLFEDLERINNTKVREGVGESSSSNLSSFDDLPTQADFKELSTSVSKTYIKLKDLIFEKRSLVTEIERLNTLNLELNCRVRQQESRLSSVSDALNNTWMLVANMKEQHEQLHSAESILRYELKEKRQLLNKLKDELECSREQWNRIRQKNTESQVEYDNLKTEFNERKRLAESLSEDSSDEAKKEVLEGAIAFEKEPTPTFEPPVDMLLDMAIEYGVVDADDETSTNIVAMMEGQDLRQDRLQHLEDQCCYLYQKLMASTSRSLALASRLSHLHRHYSGETEEDEEEDEDEEDYEEDDMEQLEEMVDDNNILDQYESEMTSPDPDSSDTAYVSEAEAGSATGGPGNLSSEEEPVPGTSSPTTLEEEEPLEVPEDDLSRRLINFLPRKIEILRHDNQKLEERCSILFEEKARSEAQLTESLETERKLRIQLEKKLEHLGKCVDELKLERNGKISEVEAQLKQKVDAASERETTLQSVTEDLEALQQKFDERGNLLSVTKERLNQVELKLEECEQHRRQAQVDLDQKVAELSASNAQLSVSKASMLTLKDSNETLHAESKTLQEQLQDMRFQLSSQAMDKETADKDQLGIVQDEAQKESERLNAQVSGLEETLRLAEEECVTIKEKLQLAESLATQESSATESAKQQLQVTQEQLRREGEKSLQLSEDNKNLREKLIQLLNKRVRVCDGCISLQSELAALVNPILHQEPQDQISSQSETQQSIDLTKSASCGPLPIGTHPPNDEDFSVISEDEVTASQLSSSADSSPAGEGSDEAWRVKDSQATPTLTPHLLTTSPPTNAEVWVGAGTRVSVPLELPSGVTLSWNFTTEPKSISFAVLHHPRQSRAAPSDPETRVLIPTTRVASAQGPVKGKLMSKQPGVYTLVFDNSSSKLTAKKVTYSLDLVESISSSTESSKSLTQTLSASKS